MVATSSEDVGIHPFDYYSWGHIDMGIVSFLLFALINIIPSLVDGVMVNIVPFWFLLVLVIIFAIVWEILENTVLLSWGFKFEGRRDSFANSFWDIIFVTIGGTIMWIIKWILVDIVMGVPGIPIFYIIGLIAFVVFFIAFVIGRAMTK